MAENQRTTVPSGAILTAVKIIEGLGGQDEPSEASAEEITTLVRVWGIPVVTEAFGFLIGVEMAIMPEAEGLDRIHDVVPAVLTRLGQMDGMEPFLATMGGVLTAAAFGEDAYEWRQGLGPITNAEAIAWCHTAWQVTDFMDDIVLGESGEFLRRIVGVVLRRADGTSDDVIIHQG